MKPLVPDQINVHEQMALANTLTIALAERDATIADLASRLSRADASIQTLTSDIDFFRGEYHRARDRVIEKNECSDQLQEQVKMLRSQLTLGLKQRELHYDAVKAQRSAEGERLRLQNRLLIDQARLTDDTVRRKAAQHGPLKKENDHLKATVYEDGQQILKLQERNEALVDQVEVMRARQMGVFDDIDAGSEGTDVGSSPLGGRDVGEMGYDTRPPGMPSSGQVYRSSQVSQGEADGDDHDEGEVDGHEGLQCKWREGADQCPVLSDTVEVKHPSCHVDSLTRLI